MDKSTVEILQKFVAFSKYMKFNSDEPKTSYLWSRDHSLIVSNLFTLCLSKVKIRVKKSKEMWLNITFNHSYFCKKVFKLHVTFPCFLPTDTEFEFTSTTDAANIFLWTCILGHAKVNSAEKACAKWFEVHILKFETLEITWKKWNKEHQTLSFQFFIKFLQDFKF